MTSFLSEGNRKVAEFFLLNMSKSWETYFLRRKDRNFRKTLNSSELHPSELSRSQGEKDISNWKSEANYYQPVTTTHQKFVTKERKKRTLHSGII